MQKRVAFQLQQNNKKGVLIRGNDSNDIVPWWSRVRLTLSYYDSTSKPRMTLIIFEPRVSVTIGRN